MGTAKDAREEVQQTFRGGESKSNMEFHLYLEIKEVQVHENLSREILAMMSFWTHSVSVVTLADYSSWAEPK